MAELAGITLFIWGIFTLDVARIIVGILLFLVPFLFGYFKDLKKKKNILNDDKLFPFYYDFNEYLEQSRNSISNFNKEQLIAYTFVFSGMMLSLKKKQMIDDQQFIELFSAVLNDKQYILGLRDIDLGTLQRLILNEKELSVQLRQLIEVGIGFVKDDLVLRPIDNNISTVIIQITKEESFPESFDQLRKLHEGLTV